MRLSLLNKILALGIVVAWTDHACAQSYRPWGLRGTGDWTVASNWQGGALPGAGDLVTIKNSGTVQVTSDIGTFQTVVAGDGASEAGHVEITGAGRLNLIRDFTAGFSVPGSLLISGGGQLTSRNGGIGIGLFESGAVFGDGTVTVTGAGSRWDMYSGGFGSFDLDIGKNSTGRGTLTISDQGVVTAEALLVGKSGGAGTVNITGAGSRLQASMTAIAGSYDGSGTFNVTDGGVMQVAAVKLGTEANSSGTVTVDGTDSLLTITNDFIIGNSGTGTVTISDSAHATVGGNTAIGSLSGGSGSLTVTGAGSLMETSGAFGIGSAGSGTLTLADNATARITGVLNLATTASGTATVNLNSGGTLELAGGATGGDGTAVINASGGTLRLTGADLTTNAAVAFGTGTTSIIDTGNYHATLSGLTSGSGGLTKNGTGTLLLTGDNSYSGIRGYTGQTTITEGTLQIGDGGTKGFLSSATMINNGQLTFNRSDLTNYAGDISGSGSVTQAGSGRLVLFGNNTYTGTTTIAAGTLEIGYNTSGSITSASIVNNAQLAFTRTDSTTYSGAISGTGSVAKWRDGTLTLSGANTYAGGTIIYGGTLTGSTASLQGDITNHAAVTFDQASAGTYAGVISSSGTLTKTGAGTLTLSGANTYEGTTTISAGTLEIGSNTSGSITSASIVNNAQLAFTRTDSTTYSGAISGTGSVAKRNDGTLTLSGANTYEGGTIIYGGTLNLGASGLASLSGDITNYAVLTFDQAYNSTYSGVISGSGSLTKRYAGTLTLSGANTYEGGTIVYGGTLAGSTASLSGDITNHAAVVFNQTSAGTYAGVISGLGTLTKTGADTLTLSSANTYSGTTTVAAGTLTLANTSASSRFAIDAAATLELNVASGTREAATTRFNGAGTLTKTGEGAVKWGASYATFALDSGALIDVQAGTFIGGSSANEVWTNNRADLTVASGATFEGVEANVRVDALNGSGTIRSGYNGAGYTAFTFGVDNGSGTFSGVLADTDGSTPGNFVKTGSGTQILSGSNTYTGTTTVAAGTLTAGSTTAFGTGDVRVNAGTLDLNGQAISNTLDVRGGNLIGLANYSGTQTLTGAMSYSGSVGGSLTIANGGALNTTGATFTGATTVQSGGSLTGTGSITGAVTVDVGGTLAPGNSPGLLTIGSGSVFNGTLNLEIGGLTRGTQYDAINIDGAGNLTFGGTLNITLIDSFAPSSGDTFDLLDYTAATSTCSFNTINLAALGTGLSWNTSDLYSTGIISVVTSAVPEPSTYAAIFGALALGFAAYRKRRRA